MTRPVKPSQRDALAGVLASRGAPEIIERSKAALLGGRRFDDDLVARVIEYLDAHPDAAGRAVAVAVRGRKKDVLSIIRALRGGSRRFREAPRGVRSA